MSGFRDQLRRHYGSKSLSPEKAAEILARGRAAADRTEAPAVAPRKVTRRVFWAGLGAAAAALVAGLWISQSVRDQVPFAAIPPRVIEFFAGNPQLPEISQDKDRLRSWLVARGAPADFRVPEKLAALESYGCQVVDVQGKPSYLTCFWSKQGAERGAPDLVHLLVTRRDDFSGTPASAAPRFERRDGWSFATWAEGDTGYTLATLLPEEKLREYVAALLAEPRWIASRTPRPFSPWPTTAPSPTA